ncbi:MAG: type II toxin-antitoxin system RelE/ParE family toxin [Bryobacterales bacterium]|nr:type II toxin-antitoxin system RelE/ParE family toxin [Bryobacterales bacterium]
MLVRWTTPAADDLTHICDYTQEHFGVAQARRTALAIHDAAGSLVGMPHRGRIGRKPTRRTAMAVVRRRYCAAGQ